MSRETRLIVISLAITILVVITVTYFRVDGCYKKGLTDGINKVRGTEILWDCEYEADYDSDYGWKCRAEFTIRNEIKGEESNTGDRAQVRWVP